MLTLLSLRFIPAPAPLFPPEWDQAPSCFSITNARFGGHSAPRTHALSGQMLSHGCTCVCLEGETPVAQGCVYASQQGWRDVEPLPWTGPEAEQFQSLMTKTWKGKIKYSGLNPDRFVHAAFREKKKKRGNLGLLDLRSYWLLLTHKNEASDLGLGEFCRCKFPNAWG